MFNEASVYLRVSLYVNSLIDLMKILKHSLLQTRFKNVIVWVFQSVIMEYYFLTFSPACESGTK